MEVKSEELKIGGRRENQQKCEVFNDVTDNLRRNTPPPTFF